jgi:DNA modification methylase
MTRPGARRPGINQNTGKLGAVANDDRADWTEVWRLFPGAVAYVWHAGLKNTVQASLELAGFTMRAQIIWAKDRMVLSRGDYHWQHEPCWYAVRDRRRQAHEGSDADDALAHAVVAGEQPSADASTLWEIPARDDEGHGHGTQKPVECMARAIRNHNALEVFEPFLGSGTTLIAAERSRVACFACELAPVLRADRDRSVGSVRERVDVESKVEITAAKDLVERLARGRQRAAKKGPTK